MNEFHYKIPWRSRGSHPGFHRSAHTGGGFEFREHAPLLRAQDPRRVDLRASLRDPFEQLSVRVYSQSNAIPVFAIVDATASMIFSGEHRKMDVVADFIAALTWSAWRTGDPVAVFTCTEQVKHDWSLPLTRAKAAGQSFAERLRTLRPEGAGIDGLLEAASLIGSRRALVFLVSDFHYTETDVSHVLNAFTRHELVPMVIWDQAEYESLPRFGLVRARDAETGHERTLLMRPGLREKIRQRFLHRRLWLERSCRMAGLRAMMIDGSFNAEQVTNYFYHQ